jgi:hypothetical protein
MSDGDEQPPSGIMTGAAVLPRRTARAMAALQQQALADALRAPEPDPEPTTTEDQQT